MAVLEVHLLSALADNYIHLLRDPDTGIVGIVDPSESEPVIAMLDQLGWRANFILNTHHHADHTAGNATLKHHYRATVIGPAADQDRIPDIDRAYADGQSFDFGSLTVQVLDIPGHTRGHIAFWFPQAQAVFAGDTLFAMGCGRLFEGTPAQMWASLTRLRGLPDDTLLYCGHEYTQANGRFALTVDPGNAALRQRMTQVDALRRDGKPTLPAALSLEKATNPFLRADQPELARAVGLAPGTDPVDVFAEIRRRKDNFRA